MTFYQVIEYISQNIGVDKFIKDNINSSISGRKIIGLKPEDFPTYAKQGLKQSSTDKFIISTHSSTEVKKSILEYLFKFYSIEGTVEVRNRIEKNDVVIGNIDSSDKSLDKMTFIDAAQKVLIDNNNEPMSAVDIWSKISERGLVDTKGKNPKGILLKTMSVHSDNSPVKDRKGTNIFNITQTSPIKFKLLNPNKIQNVEDNFENENIENEYYLLGAYDGQLGKGQKSELWKQYVDGGYWLNGFAVAGVDKLKEEVNNIPVGANVAIKSSYVRGKVNPVIMIKARGIVTKNYEDGTKIDVDWEKNFKPFEIIRSDVGGYRQTLHDISNKQEHIDLIFNSESNSENEDDFIEPFTTRFGMPIDYKAVQAEEEKIEKNYNSEDYSANPFRQAICVLGKSGAGKSYTIDEILEKDSEERPHKYEFIIPSASTTGLLSQFSPSAKEGRGGYVPSRLGKLIENAYKNKNTLYTIVLDECHKSNIIEMINDELLQAISTGRNKNRFISLDDETADLYPSKFLDRRNNIIIPENIGFIFISSNARVIAGNDDFFNRVDLVELKEEDKGKVNTIEDLDSKRVKKTEEKYDLVSKIMAYTGRKN
jgi:hypothetical protein